MERMSKECGRNLLLRLVMLGIVFNISCAVTGCSSVSWVIHHNPKTSDLFVTEDEIDNVIEELTTAEPKETDAVVYNQVTDRYELKPGVYKNALRDGIIKRIQDKKIKAFLKDYRPETFGSALKDDAGTAGILIILLGVLGGFLY